jgi:hypothetical protein
MWRWVRPRQPVWLGAQAATYQGTNWPGTRRDPLSAVALPNPSHAGPPGARRGPTWRRGHAGFVLGARLHKGQGAFDRRATVRRNGSVRGTAVNELRDLMSANRESPADVSANRERPADVARHGKRQALLRRRSAGHRPPAMGLRVGPHAWRRRRGKRCAVPPYARRCVVTDVGVAVDERLRARTVHGLAPKGISASTRREGAPPASPLYFGCDNNPPRALPSVSATNTFGGTGKCGPAWRRD